MLTQDTKTIASMSRRFVTNLIQSIYSTYIVGDLDDCIVDRVVG